MLATQVHVNRIKLGQRSLLDLILHECQLSPLRRESDRLVIDFCFSAVRLLGVLLYTAIYCSSLTIDFEEGDSTGTTRNLIPVISVGI
jgi:hypothetical protein